MSKDKIKNEKIFGYIFKILTFRTKQSVAAFVFCFFMFFYLYLYFLDWEESDGGAIHRVGNYPDLLPEMPRYCCPLVI